MALKVEDTRVLTIDGQTIAVETLSPEVKELVTHYDHWKQQAVELRSNLQMIQLAMQGLASQIAQAATGGGEEVAANEAEVAEDASGDNPDGE